MLGRGEVTIEGVPEFALRLCVWVTVVADWLLVNALLIELATSVEPSASTTVKEKHHNHHQMVFDGFASADQNVSTDHLQICKKTLVLKHFLFTFSHLLFISFLTTLRILTWSFGLCLGLLVDRCGLNVRGGDLSRRMQTLGRHGRGLDALCCHGCWLNVLGVDLGNAVHGHQLHRVQMNWCDSHAGLGRNGCTGGLSSYCIHTTCKQSRDEWKAPQRLTRQESLIKSVCIKNDARMSFHFY